MKHLMLFCLLLIGMSCNQIEDKELDALQIEEINKLITDEQKDSYLYDLWQKDQNNRGGKEGEIISKYGDRSEEHIEFAKECRAKDNIIFKKIKYYLETHGYPKNKAKYHELAINAFPIIIGHNHNYQAQKELLPYLYSAYKEGSCSIGDVVWVLGEMHESKHRGKRYKMKSNKFRTEDEFKELSAALNLNLEL